MDVHGFAVALLEVESDRGDGVAVLFRGGSRRDIGDTACAVSTLRNGKVKHSRICRSAVGHACLATCRTSSNLSDSNRCRLSVCARLSRWYAEIEHRRFRRAAVVDSCLAACREGRGFAHLHSCGFALRASYVHGFGVRQSAVVCPRKVAVGVHRGREGHTVFAVRTVLTVRTGGAVRTGITLRACVSAWYRKVQDCRILRSGISNGCLTSRCPRSHGSYLYRCRNTGRAICPVFAVRALLTGFTLFSLRTGIAPRYRDFQYRGILRPRVFNARVCTGFACYNFPYLYRRCLSVRTVFAGRAVRSVRSVCTGIAARYSDIKDCRVGRADILDTCVCTGCARKHLSDCDGCRLALYALCTRQVADKREIRFPVRGSDIEFRVVGVALRRSNHHELPVGNIRSVSVHRRHRSVGLINSEVLAGCPCRACCARVSRCAFRSDKGVALPVRQRNAVNVAAVFILSIRCNVLNADAVPSVRSVCSGLPCCALRYAEVQDSRVFVAAVRNGRLTSCGKRGNLPDGHSCRCARCPVLAVSSRRPVLTVRAVLSGNTLRTRISARNGDVQNCGILCPDIGYTCLTSCRTRCNCPDLYRGSNTVLAVNAVGAVGAVFTGDALNALCSFACAFVLPSRGGGRYGNAGVMLERVCVDVHVAHHRRRAEFKVCAHLLSRARDRRAEVYDAAVLSCRHGDDTSAPRL